MNDTLDHISVKLDSLDAVGEKWIETSNVCNSINARVKLKYIKLNIQKKNPIFPQLHKIDINVAFRRDPVNVDNQLPFKNNEQIFKFLSNEDGMLPARKESLMRHLYAVCDESSLQNFKNSICAALFDPVYLASNRWPHRRYIALIYNL